MTTPYDEKRARFSRRGHAAAQLQVYPRWFHGIVTEEDTVNTKLDMEYAVDCKLHITSPVFKYGSVHLTLQERWRRPQYREWGDATITEYNHLTRKVSELYKLDAQLFVYGIYCAQADRIVAADAYLAAAIIAALANGRITGERGWRPDRTQSFLAFKRVDLEKIGAGVLSYKVDRDPVVGGRLAPRPSDGARGVRLLGSTSKDAADL